MKAVLLPTCSSAVPPTARLLGKTLLAHAMDGLAAAGVDRFLLMGPEPLPTPGRHSVSRSDIPPGGGSAGALARCADFVGEEDFWLLEGGLVWDCPLDSLPDLRRDRGAEAVVLLAHSRTPHLHTAAACDPLGRVIYFEERPPLARCMSTAVASGLALCAPEVFSRLPPEGSLDGGLFPALLVSGGLWAVPARGLCRVVRTHSGLLEAAVALLSQCPSPLPPETRRRPGLYSRGPLPEGVDFIPPCWLDEGVSIGPGSLIGPHAALERGTVVGSRCLVQHSLLDGCTVGDRATLYGTVAGRGASLGPGCTLHEGAAVPPGGSVPAGAAISGEGEDMAAMGWENPLYFL